MSRGFTLIEVLVVVAVIGLLMSILLPSLGAAREASRQTVCASNLRQMMMGLRMYADENSRWLPTAEPPSREYPDHRHWFMNASLLKRVNAPLRYTEAGEPIGPAKAGTVLICPSHPDPATWRDGTPLAYGLSYGMNGTWGLGGRPDHVRPRRMDEFKREAEVMAFMDAGGSDAAPGIVLYRMCPKENIQFRHRGRSSVAYVDGHVGARREGDIPFGMENRHTSFWSTQKP